MCIFVYCKYSWRAHFDWVSSGTNKYWMYNVWISNCFWDKSLKVNQILFSCESPQLTMTMFFKKKWLNHFDQVHTYYYSINKNWKSSSDPSIWHIFIHIKKCWYVILYSVPQKKKRKVKSLLIANIERLQNHQPFIGEGKNESDLNISLV